jgi:hypothetical protein
MHGASPTLPSYPFNQYGLGTGTDLPLSFISYY